MRPAPVPHACMSRIDIPLFPLKTVLFPGGPLPLRVFEPRYLDMISRCLREDHGFGVVLIHEGRESGPVSRLSAVGTMASIVDWYQGDDGLLGVTAHGRQRFRLHEVTREDDGLNVGSVELLAPEVGTRLPARFGPLSRILETVLGDLGPLYDDIEKRYDDATWVGYRLAELLPVPISEKQALLELEDPEQRLERLLPVVQSIQQDA